MQRIEYAKQPGVNTREREKKKENDKQNEEQPVFIGIPSTWNRLENSASMTLAVIVRKKFQNVNCPVTTSTTNCNIQDLIFPIFQSNTLKKLPNVLYPV